jgi:hypothetical protein
MGHHHCGLRNGAGCIASQAQGRGYCCGLRNGITGLGMNPALSTAPPARVRDDGGT